MQTYLSRVVQSKIEICIYRGLPPMKSDHLRTSGGMPSLRGNFSLMQRAKSSAVCIDGLVCSNGIKGVLDSYGSLVGLP
jgi:hypothetical protein